MQSDSGGPLLQITGERKTLIGTTSYGPEFCAPNSNPGVYTRVSSFIPWIEQVVQQDFDELANETPLDVNKRISVE